MLNRTAGVIAVLALVQSALGVLRALHWLQLGSDLLGQGLLVLPMVGMGTDLGRHPGDHHVVPVFTCGT